MEKLTLENWKLNQIVPKRKDSENPRLFVKLTGVISVEALGGLFKDPKKYQALNSLTFETMTIKGGLQTYDLELSGKPAGIGEVQPFTELVEVKIDTLKVSRPAVEWAEVQILFVCGYSENLTAVQDMAPYLGDEIRLQISDTAQTDIEDEEVTDV